MRPLIYQTIAGASLLVQLGCATVTPGPEGEAVEARKVLPSPEKTTMYFCREWAYLGGGVSIFPRVNGKAVAKLELNTFTRIDLPPGKYDISIGFFDDGDSALYKAMQSGPKQMETIEGKAAEVRYYWIGVAGQSFLGGVLTVDHFDNKSQAMECFDSATYVSPKNL